MFENITKIFKNWKKKENKSTNNSGGTAKERLHLVLMQDRANVSADFLELMKQEIIEVIKKYIDVDESAIDVRLTNKENGDGTNGAPALYANIPILNIKNEARKVSGKEIGKESVEENKEKEESKETVVEQDKKEIEEKKEEEAEEKVEQAEIIIEEAKKEEEQKENEDKELNKDEDIKVEDKTKVKEEVKSENN